MKVREIMKTGVESVTPETSYEEAVKIMVKHKFSGLPVIDKKGSMVGILSEKDLFRALYPKYEEYATEPDIHRDQEEQEQNIDIVRKTPVSSYMTKSVIMVSADAPILRAGGLMLANNISRLPVMENGKIIGIVGRGDVYHAILRQYLDLF